MNTQTHNAPSEVSQDFSFITRLDNKLNAGISLQPSNARTDSWVMHVHLFYEGESAGITSFNLHGYSEAEAQTVVKNLRHNAQIMYEIDAFLWGESD